MSELAPNTPVSRTATRTFRPSHSGKRFIHEVACISSLGSRPCSGNELLVSGPSVRVIVVESVLESESIDKSGSAAPDAGREFDTRYRCRRFANFVELSIRELAIGAEAIPRAIACMQ